MGFAVEGAVLRVHDVGLGENFMGEWCRISGVRFGVRGVGNATWCWGTVWWVEGSGNRVWGVRGGDPEGTPSPYITSEVVVN